MVEFSFSIGDEVLVEMFEDRWYQYKIVAREAIRTAGGEWVPVYRVKHSTWAEDPDEPDFLMGEGEMREVGA